MPSRSTTQLITAACSTTALMVSVPLPVVSGAPADSHRASAILLHNGNVLEGTIRREEDCCHVFLSAGRVTIPAGDIAYIGERLIDIYHHQRGQVLTDRPATMVDLVQWCLRNDLVKEARCEWKRLAALDPKHPRLEILDEQITFRQKQPADSKTDGSRRDHTRQRWDRMVRRWSPDVMHQFATRIQPLLVRHCATAGCHEGSSGGQFRLRHHPGRGVQARAATLDNLAAVLPLVSDDDPSTSPLLTFPIRPHASQHPAVFGHRDARPYAALVDWTRRVAAIDSHHRDRLAHDADQPSGDRVAETRPRPSSVNAKTAQKRVTEPRDPARKPRAATQPAAAPVARLQTPTSVGQTDPFDPAIFNRRFATGARPDDR